MKKVAISIAHSERRPGACYDQFCENEESQIWSLAVKEALRKIPIGVTVVPGGRLSTKVQIVNGLSVQLAIEIHFNACGGCGAKGCETLFYPGSIEGHKAAMIFQRHLVPAMRTKDRGVKEGWYKMDRPGVVDFYGDEEGDEMPDYFLKKTNCPALILEPEFIEHPSLIQAYRRAGVKAIANAIKEYLYDWKD